MAAAPSKPCAASVTGLWPIEQGGLTMDSRDLERHSPDQPVLRRTRLRFLAWSAGVTLVALIVVGAAIYAAVARSLADASTGQLRSRAADLGTAVASGKAPFLDGGDAAFVVSDPGKPGVVFGGSSSGTLGIVTMSVPAPDGQPGVTAGGPGLDSSSSSGFVKRLQSGAIALMPIDPDGMAAARAGRMVVHELVVDGTPVRVLSEGFNSGGTNYVVQVIADRTSEQRTLGIILAVLSIGSFLALGGAPAVSSLLFRPSPRPIRVSPP